MAIKVLEVDQWTSTGNIREYNFSTWRLEDVIGGDSAAARAIFGGHGLVREVEKHQIPQRGYIWFQEENDRFKLYKANYDSSD